MTDTEQPKNQAGSSRCNCGCMGAGPMFSRVLHMFEPPAGADQHFRQARIEFLKGVRSLLDHSIDRISQDSAKGTRINVE